MSVDQGSGLHVVTIERQDPRLGRQCVHDERSRAYEHTPRGLGLSPAALEHRRFRHRVYGPRRTPSQRVGCCTGVDQCVQANTVGNRVRGRVLGLDTAEAIYRIGSHRDPFEGGWEPDDTGSSGLAASMAAIEMGLASRVEWIFAGPQAVLTALRERPVGIGTWWHAGMFHPDAHTLLVKPTGGRVGGHQWTLIGWEPELRAFEGLCWWGEDFGRRGLFRIGYDDLGALLADDGDAHVTYPVPPSPSTL